MPSSWRRSREWERVASSTSVETIRPALRTELGRRALAFRFRELTLLPAIALAVLAGSLVSDAFLTKDNLLNILQQSSELSVLVVAESLILIAGKFDLSLESVVGLAPMLGAWLIATDTGI